MEKKDINAKSTIRALITGFVSYSMIVGFISFVILCIVTRILDNFEISTPRGLYITLPLMVVIIAYFVIHMICNASTYDVFKSYKTSPDNYKKISKSLTIFFIICIFLFIFTFLELLHLVLVYQEKSILYSTLRSSQVFSEEHVNELAESMWNSYDYSKTNSIIATVILTIGITVSMLSLIPYQRNLIVKYNTIIKENKNNKDNIEVISDENVSKD